MGKVKEITIKRKVSFREANNKDPEVQDYFSGAKVAIGSQFKASGVKAQSGLTREEELALMPEVLDIYLEPHNRSEFDSRVNKYFKEFFTPIPMEGLKLRVDLENDELPLVYYENGQGDFSLEKKEGYVRCLNTPSRVNDYLKYRHALSHFQVAKNEIDAYRYGHKKFYIDDPDATTSSKIKITELEDQAQTIYLSIKSDDLKVKKILTLLGQNTKKMSPEDARLELKKRASANSKIAETSNIKNLSRFISIAEDKDLSQKYDIEEYINNKILERHGSVIMIADNGEEIGVDMKEAVSWFSRPENSKQINIFKAQYDELVKKD